MKGSKMQAMENTQCQNPPKNNADPQAATPALQASPSLQTHGLGLWPLLIYSLARVILRVRSGDLGDAGICF